MPKIAICVCTRKRPEGILALLESIELLDKPIDTDLKIIVVENDTANYTENLILEYSYKSQYKILYFLEKNQGIAFARNHTVKESGDVDFCCFVDDDQVVDKNWLKELLRCQQEFYSDGVWGQNPPVFKTRVPEYIELFHKPETYEYGTTIKQAYTNCLLLKKTWLDKYSGPFDLRLNYTGGEDSFLTSNIIKDGGVIRFNPYAIAYEIIPPKRATIRYIMKRSFRMRNTKLLVLSLLSPVFSKYSYLPRLIMRLCNGVLITLPCLLSKSKKLNGIIKISDSLGGLMFIFGRKNLFYK